MTPNAIEVLIHCHVSADTHPRHDQLAVRQALDALRLNGLIKEHANQNKYPFGYDTTERGKAHIDQLCSTAWPVQVWVDAYGNIIGKESGT